MWHIYLRGKNQGKIARTSTKWSVKLITLLTSLNEKKSGLILLKSVAVLTTITIFLEWFFDCHSHCHRTAKFHFVILKLLYEFITDQISQWIRGRAWMLRRTHKNARFMCCQRCNHKNDKHKRRINLFYLSVMLWEEEEKKKLVLVLWMSNVLLHWFHLDNNLFGGTCKPTDFSNCVWAFSCHRFSFCLFVACLVLSGMPHHALRYVQCHAIDKVSGHIFSAIWEPFG